MLQQPREWILKFLFVAITMVENPLRRVADVLATGLAVWWVRSLAPDAGIVFVALVL